MQYDDTSLKQYLEELAGGAATPGGGSAAALIGATGAALVSMVGNLTIGRKKYAAVEAEMQDLVSASCALKDRLLALVSEDTEVFQVVMAAYKLPKATAEEQAARQLAIDDSLRTACGVPLKIAEAAIEVLRLAAQAAEHGNINAVSDAAVGSLGAHAALYSGLLNVRINLKSLPQDAWWQQTLARVETMEQQGDELNQTVQKISRIKLGA